MPNLDALAQRLLTHQTSQLERIRCPYMPHTAPYVQYPNGMLLNFTSNDYLALSQHPTLIRATQEAVQTYGLGALGSAIAQGYTPVHQQLEQALCTWLNTPRALVFTSGYLAVLAIITALIDQDDFIAVDKQSHACVFDAIRLTQARWQRYADDDLTRLESLLQHRTKGARFIITSGIFSMQGHLARLQQLCALAQQYEAIVIVDDVHSTGVLGQNGQGSLAQLGLGVEQIPIVIGSLSKGLGTVGAFVAGNDRMIEAALQFARPYMFSTTLPSALASASIAAIEIAQCAQAERAHLQQLGAYFMQRATQLAIPVLPSSSPIKAVPFSSIAAMQTCAQSLLAENILVSPIRPPTVARNSARMRMALTKAHQFTDIDRLLTAMKTHV
ncbi:MAG TPA: 8-amino-7-oxononanoate synthase [Gammaproteobacteria bacterium]|nr:8-amino-7-oxononanoate synthase [Gammaproteobacteria bacterium]